uniref:Phosphatidylglycerophosphate synthase n=1 Tax=Eubacterium cellulosolvens (strain ATCC 43171 / JCM 9499 / 6) TaxID=633697 RepID=I5AWB7_EUBC6
MIAAGMFLISRSRSYHLVLNVLFVMSGVGWSCIAVNGVVVTVSGVGDDHAGRLASLYYVASSLSKILAPVISGVILEHLQYRALYTILSLFFLSAIALLVVGRRMGRIAEDSIKAGKEVVRKRFLQKIAEEKVNMNSDEKNVEVQNSTEQMVDAGSAGDPVKTVPSVLENKFADFTYKFVKYIPESVHPNTVTGIGIICGILGAFCFFLATFSRWFFIPAALGLVTHIVCDNFDGYMARNRNQKSARGAFFDFCSDVLVCTFAALFLGLSSYAHLELLQLHTDRRRGEPAYTDKASVVYPSYHPSDRAGVL